jgi:hypothetical protein
MELFRHFLKDLRRPEETRKNIRIILLLAEI